MNVQEAVILFRYYQQSHHRKRTIDSYQTLLGTFEHTHGKRSLESMQSDEIYQFLENTTARSAKSTRRLRYAQLKAFFNFIVDKCHHDMVDALSLLQQEGFPVLKSLLADNEDDAARKALEIGLPVTLKPSSPDVIHKTETGGIRVSLKDEAEVRQAFRDIVKTFASNFPEKRLDGVLVQKQGSGLEVIVGMLRDQQFGPVLMFGLGGIFVEAMKDVTFRLIPIEKVDAKEMMEELRNYGVLRNPRSGSLDLPAVDNLLVGISTFIAHHPEIQEMDLNPVFVSSHGVQICDARIKLHSNESDVKG